MDTFVYKDHKKLRCGYTTGTCAALAAQGAVRFLLTGSWKETEEIMTPKGILVAVSLEEKSSGDGWAECAVRKDAGDDYDVTNGILVYARAEKEPPGLRLEDGSQQEKEKPDQQNAEYSETLIEIDGGIGIGRVTKPGLDQPVGAAAINSVPRKMIRDAVYALLEEAGEFLPVSITISVPAGVEAAKKTFNPVLGIEGGISVLGTSGIVEPMSEKALIDTIRVEMKVRREENNKLLLTAPGNYGRGFMQDKYGIDIDAAVKCSNYIGETIDIANELGFERMLLIGHIGKLIKVSGGIMNTHSSCADARLELLAAHGIRAGADVQTARAILDCVTTEEALSILLKAGLLEKTMQFVIDRIAYYAGKRTDRTQIEIILFSNEQGELARTAHAMDYLEEYRHGTFCRSGSGSTGSDHGER